MYINMYVYKHIYIYIYTYMYTNIYICIYIITWKSVELKYGGTEVLCVFPGKERPEVDEYNTPDDDDDYFKR
jgi:hypothetical protein